MRIIYKYPINSGLRIPRGAQVLRVDLQRGEPHVWAIVNRDESRTDLYEVIPTGVEFDETKVAHVGTWEHGQYIWHLFRVTESEDGA